MRCCVNTADCVRRRWRLTQRCIHCTDWQLCDYYANANDTRLTCWDTSTKHCHSNACT